MILKVDTGVRKRSCAKTTRSGERFNRLTDCFDRPLGSLGADLDGFLRTVKIEHADVAEPRADHDIGGIAGQSRAGDAILHDVIGLDHYGRQAGPSLPAEKFSPQEFLRAESPTPSPLC